LLETVRLYGLEKLEAAGVHEAAALRHFEYYLRSIERGRAVLGSSGQQEWFLRLEREQANVRAALDWAIGCGRAEEAASMALALAGFWTARAYHREADCWLTQIVELPGRANLPAQQRARLLGAIGTVAQTLNEFEQAERYLQEALAIWQEVGDKIGIATALKDLGWQRFQKMDLVGARKYAQESLGLARQAGDRVTIALALQILTAAAAEAGWNDGLVPALEECLSIWRSLGAQKEAAAALGVLARVEQKLQHPERAARFMLEALSLQADLGDYASLITYLVLMLAFEFDVDRAPPRPDELGGYQQFAYLEHGRLLHGPVEATRALGAMAAWEDRIVGVHTVQWDAMVVPLCNRLRADMGEAAFEREFAASRAMSLDDVVAFAQDYARSVLAIYSQQAPASRTPARPPVQAPVRAASAPTWSHGWDELTPREAEVLRLVADGLTNRQAAERLVVTPRTINAHLTSIYSKIGVSSRAAAVRFAMEHGLA
jgi:non-specific serine/threonine protein kinase